MRILLLLLAGAVVLTLLYREDVWRTVGSYFRASASRTAPLLPAPPTAPLPKTLPHQVPSR